MGVSARSLFTRLHQQRTTPPKPVRGGRSPTATIAALCGANSVPTPRCELLFHPHRSWRFDLAWPESMVALEIEGGLWQKGGTGHSHPLGIERDMEKSNAAVLLGWRVLRFPPERLADGIAAVRLLMMAD